MRYFDDPATARRHGGAARSAVMQRFSLDRMVQDYRALYDATRKQRHPGISRGDRDRRKRHPIAKDGTTMCGIVGIFDTRGKSEISRPTLERMNNRQRHRGPDDEGYLIEPGIGLGHRRLSIIDLATGHQPLFNEDGSVGVVFNGEIYNYPGADPRAHSPGAHVSHAQRYGGDRSRLGGVGRVLRHAVPRHVRVRACGTAIASRLFLARDRLGVKPLFYAWLPGGRFIFGSELKALVEHGGWSTALDDCAIEDYFALGYIPEPRTIYTQVAKLPPAHTLLVQRGVAPASPREYWDVRFTGDSRQSEAEAQDELVARLRESVRLRMIADVPLGAFLSGGVDSSAVVSLMAGLSSAPVNTCSIRFADPAFDESAWAQQVATRYRTRHFVEDVESDDYGLIDELARALRRAVRRQLGHSHVPRLPARPPSCHGRVVRRWRRRRIRRLPALPPAPGRGAPALGFVGFGAAAVVRAARPRLSEG